MPFSHHSHSGQFCGHAQNTLAEMVSTAFASYMSVFALTEHVPRSDLDLYPEEVRKGVTATKLDEQFAGFVAEARRIREGLTNPKAQAEAANLDVRNECRVLIGFETEWIRAEDSSQIVRQLLTRNDGFTFDFFVGSVHHVRTIPIDFDRETYLRAQDTCGGEQQLWEEYFDSQSEMLQTLQPRIVGHFDVIRLFCDEPDRTLQHWDQGHVWEKVTRNLRMVKDYGGLLEINSSALRKGLAEPYPKKEICMEWLALGGRFVLSDDSHGIEQVGTNYRKVLQFLKDLEVTEISYLNRNDEGPVTVETMSIGEVERHPFWNAVHRQ